MTFLYQEWPGLLQDLFDSEKITEEQFQNNSHLNIVGMVGSIDNGKIKRFLLDTFWTLKIIKQGYFALSVILKECNES